VCQGANNPKAFESLLGFLRRPVAAVHRSMLCVPALVHRQVLGLGRQTENPDEPPTIPVLIQVMASLMTSDDL
jgi:hypothetical protein